MPIDPSAIIHKTAIVADGAQIGADVEVGAYTVIDANVVIGKGSSISHHVVISGNTVLGCDNKVYPFASIGTEPQDLKYIGENSELRIGSRNIIREYVTLQPGTAGGGMVTSIGDQNLFMASSHVGHDSHVGDRNIMANGSALAGHVQMGSNITIGGLCGIHQFVRLGDFSFLGGGAMVVQDIPPYCLAQGDRAYLFGLNTVGLKRHGFSIADLKQLKTCYRELFVRNGKLQGKMKLLREELGGVEHVDSLLAFLADSRRGITSARQDENRVGSDDS